MHRILALACLTLLVISAGCSAVVQPDTTRLGGGGPRRDSGVAPGTDGGMVMCPPGQLSCGGSCVQASSDPSNCGRCGNACAPSEACVSGVCSGSVGGILGNPSDCGPSHTMCRAIQVCVSGACTCRPPYTLIGATCIDLTSDPNNCGAPGRTCPGNCAGGNCINTDCPTGTTSCDGACVDLRRDPGNCGDCGRTCRGNQICAGQCRDVTVPVGCTACPCDACGGGAACCTYPSVGVPVCIDGIDSCPVL